MHHDCGVSACDYTTQDTICPSCTADLVAMLRAIAQGGVHRIRVHRDWDPIRRVHIKRPPVTEHHPGLWEDLETTLTRQGKVGPINLPVRGKGETPLPFHEAASEVKTEVLRTVRHWKAVFLAANQHLAAPASAVPASCTWLARYPSLLAALPDAPNMLGDFQRLAGRHGMIQQVINRAPDRIYLGICSAPVEGEEFPCGNDVFALQGRDWAVCSVCKTEHEVASRRDRLLEAVGREVVNSVRASRLLASFGIRVPSPTIRSWTQRRNVRGKWIEPRLFPHSKDELGRPLYLVQHILDEYTKSLEKKGKAA
jgi:hypothetical protein